MATYMSFVKWTDQGIKHAKDVPKRLDAFEAAVKAAGGKLKAVYPVTGECDRTVITEAPGDEVVARLSLATAMQGNVRTVTSRAFTREETTKIVAGLP